MTALGEAAAQRISRAELIEEAEDKNPGWKAVRFVRGDLDLRQQDAESQFVCAREVDGWLEMKREGSALSLPVEIASATLKLIGTPVDYRDDHKPTPIECAALDLAFAWSWHVDGVRDLRLDQAPTSAAKKPPPAKKPQIPAFAVESGGAWWVPFRMWPEQADHFETLAEAEEWGLYIHGLRARIPWPAGDGRMTWREGRIAPSGTAIQLDGGPYLPVDLAAAWDAYAKNEPALQIFYCEAAT